MFLVTIPSQKAAKEEEVPGLGGKNELRVRVRYPSGANRYPSAVKARLQSGYIAETSHY